MKPLDKFTTFKNTYQKTNNLKTNQVPEDDIYLYRNIINQGFNNNLLARNSQTTTEHQSQKLVSILEKKIKQAPNFIESDDDMYCSASNSSEDSSKTSSSSDDISETDRDESQSDYGLNNSLANNHRNEKSQRLDNKGKKGAVEAPNAKSQRNPKKKNNNNNDKVKELTQNLNKNLDMNLKNNNINDRKSKNMKEYNKTQVAADAANESKRIVSRNQDADGNYVVNGISFNNNLSSISSINPNNTNSVCNSNNIHNDISSNMINNINNNPSNQQYQKFFQNKKSNFEAPANDDINNHNANNITNKKTPDFNQLKEIKNEISNKNNDIKSSNNNKSQFTSTNKEIPKTTSIHQKTNAEEKYSKGYELMNPELVKWMKNPLTNKKDSDSSLEDEADSSSESSDVESDGETDPSKSVSALQMNFNNLNNNNTLNPKNKINLNNNDPSSKIEENLEKPESGKIQNAKVADSDVEGGQEEEKHKSDRMDIVLEQNRKLNQEDKMDIIIEVENENINKAQEQINKNNKNNLHKVNAVNKLNIKLYKEESSSSGSSGDNTSSIYGSERFEFTNPNIREIKKQSHKANKDNKIPSKQRDEKLEVSNFAEINKTKNTDIKNNVRK